MDNHIEIQRTGRGVFLWIMLANSILVSFVRLLSLLFPASFANIYAGEPSWGYVFNLMLFIAEVIGITGTIVWRKWGVYVLVAIVLIGTSKDFLSLGSQTSIVDILLTIPILVLFIWAVKRKWSYFK